LKNGDRLAGTLVSEDTNRVVITTSWIKDLAIPVSEIASREKISETITTRTAPATNSTASAPTGSQQSITNKAAGPAVAVAGSPAPPKPSPPKIKHWHGEARIGTDYLAGATDQQIYYARFKLTYEKPYVSDPKHFLRNFFDYTLDYGRTDGVLSANRMAASNKTDVDVGTKRLFVYNLLGVGYDQIRKIDLGYEVGPGVGYHLLNKTNLVINVESGVDFQAENRSDQTQTRDFFLRLAQDVTWKLNKQTSLTEKFEFFPRVDSADYRARLESNVSYCIWQCVSLNLSLLDLYDTQPAEGVPPNDLQLRSSLGVTF
jgi:hypothetical protein